jgi:hypothetical protein
MDAQNVLMARKPAGDKAKKPNEAYRKKARMVRVREKLAEVGDQLAEDLAKDLTELVNDAFREYLERHGRWPVQGKPST